MLDGDPGENEPSRRKSYDKDEMDAFVDLMEQELSRVVDENTDLKAVIADQTAVIAQLRAELGRE
ncbi:hypothetical protein [Nocardia huaxiensis]|uniref:Antigen 84 n=1 Tax=Nocardia huaxiensis TaxID=2755382 RepID=A0A7D6Z4X0_9NOCA|nr:hypothetical protein [Nocardia huaxiensis]QLY31364.1 hypothetical protein H0264_03090 [Nocardia huaxiensis]UFS94907.1 DivIVA domain-containing protein [Nocardia huaxiensis]